RRAEPARLEVLAEDRRLRQEMRADGDGHLEELRAADLRRLARVGVVRLRRRAHEGEALRAGAAPVHERRDARLDLVSEVAQDRDRVLADPEAPGAERTRARAEGLREEVGQVAELLALDLLGVVALEVL